MTTSPWQRLQTIDRRVIYVLLLASIITPLFIQGSPVPIIPSQQSKDFYNTIEDLARADPQHKKLVIVDGWWAAGTKGGKPVAGPGHYHAPDAARNSFRHFVV